MPYLVTRVPKQTASDKKEKTRQSLASLNISNIYQYIFAGILFVLLLRQIVLRTRLYVARRRHRAQGPLATATSEKGTPTSSLYTTESWFFRGLGRVDDFAGSQVGLPLLGNCTWFKLVMSTFVVALNLTFCLIIDTQLHSVPTPNSNVARAFARRCGRIAVANFPFLFILSGRNNLVSIVTGFPYQEVRFYHKLLGILVLLESFVHVVAYTIYYCVELGVEKFHGEFEELYFKMGIAATVAGLCIAVTSIPYIRKGWYEVFLVTHVIGAAVLLAGTWYHRPIIQNWVYAAVAFWSFERAARLGSHIINILHARVVLRHPLLTSTAKVQHGAILLTIPFPAGGWEAGQHVYISFWGKHLLSKPWLYGQAHPFSVVNTPADSATDHELHFVLRIKDGITRALANHIEAVARNSQKAVELTVSIEGPYGRTPGTEHYDSLLLVAGGSGITHIASILEDVAKQAKEGVTHTVDVTLVWAVHHLDQTEWLGDQLAHVRAVADQAQLNLKLNIYVTRPDAASGSSSIENSRSSSPTSERQEGNEKKAPVLENAVAELPDSRAAVRHGRPDVSDYMHRTVADSFGHTLVVACGPTELAKVVRDTASHMASSALHVEVASFES